MNAIQQYLFPEMNFEIEQARASLISEPVAPKAHEAFIADIRAAITRSPEGELIIVGCSAVVDHGEIADQIVLKQQADTSGHPRPAVLKMAMPPLVTSCREQNEALLDRYIDGVHATHLRYKHRPLFLSQQLSMPRSRTESVIETLTNHGLDLVCITDAQNIACGQRRIDDVDRKLQQLRDIAQRTNSAHVLIGEMSVLWKAVSKSHLVSKIQVVMQPLCDPKEKAAHNPFVALLKAYQKRIANCSNLDLAERYDVIMARVAGDHRRFSNWLTQALCEAGRRGSCRLEWKDLSATVPSKIQVNDAQRALNAYLEFSKGKAFEFPADSNSGKLELPESAAPKDKVKPFEAIPRRDLVANVA